MKLSLDISGLVIEELSYPAFEMLSKLLRKLNHDKEQRISLQDPNVMTKLSQALLSNKSSSVKNIYLELVREIRLSEGRSIGPESSQGSVEFKPRSKYKSIDPGSFNKSYKEDLVTGEY